MKANRLPGRGPCGKLRYLTELDAQIALSNARKFVMRVQPIRTYLCPVCGYWNLTKQPERKP